MKPRNTVLFLLLLLVVSGSYGHNLTTGAAPERFSIDASPMDTVYGIDFATRVDSLYKYVEIEPTASWKIIYRDGMAKPDLQNGDLLRVTSENGTVKDYYLKLNKYIPGSNAYLSSITWPDMPESFRGPEAISYGWKGDTIPSFNSLKMDYVLILPLAYQKIPALTFYTQHPNATVAVTRAKSLEGSIADRTITFSVTAEDGITTNLYSVLLNKEKEQDTLDIQTKSTVTSMYYKVSEGNSLNETIKGVAPGSTVTDFLANITKVHELQALKVISASSGAELTQDNRISYGDILEVVSADRTNTSKYILEVINIQFPSSAILTSPLYTVAVTWKTGTISGFPKYTLIKKILEGVVLPAEATLTVVDRNDAYKTITILNYDTAYVYAMANTDVYFEVIGENGLTKVLYQLMPTSQPSDGYVTSDLYSVDQSALLIAYIRQGTSVSSLLRHVTPAPGATMKVIDKWGFDRPSGVLYKDDKLVVISKDGNTYKAYYFATASLNGGPYVAFVLSDKYMINQINYTIADPKKCMDVAELKSNLFSPFNTTIKIMGANGIEITRSTLYAGDKVEVTSADGTQTTTYHIEMDTGPDPFCGTSTFIPFDGASTISMVPNPTSDRVVIQGLAKGSRLRVLNPSGIVVIDDEATDNSEKTISLNAQPKGLYLFVVYDCTQHIKIQKIVKQ